MSFALQSSKTKKQALEKGIMNNQKFRILLVFLLLMVVNFSPSLVNAQHISNNNFLFLPVVFNNYCNSGSCKFIGIFMGVPMWNRQSVAEIEKANNISAVKHSVIGWSISLQNKGFVNSAQSTMSNNFYGQLEALWEKGYVSFINISSEPASDWTTNIVCPYFASAKDVADGKCDAAIDKMAELYSNWISQGNGRIAFIAPFPEMNGVTVSEGAWTSYGGDAQNFKKAFEKIQQRFAMKGISKDKVWWVFAPNGWNDSALPQHAFENYYPGDNLVDVVAFSSYNFGYCWKSYQSNSQGWYEYDSVFKPYLDRFVQLAPSKPIIIAQTGVTAEDRNDPFKFSSRKNNWLRDTYRLLAQHSSVLGVIYFDPEPDCKWSITKYGDLFKQGYLEGTSHFLHMTVDEINQMINK